ncbi:MULTISPECIES: YxiF family protein [Bacillus cereus group]|uniref:Group-specific protein n=2 Tax=Bacillus wiedmannii TaxID=1890302 RepID=A0A4U2V4X8_9BACI|nr:MULTISPECIES: hypothetical protein [Bacillus cereus group]MCU5095069.1 hypothetical protein [Bacillus wiedmannii]MCU5683902.1 hypothetical protein [Bacillus wiedmannii]TKI14558.1 hypothetical protein FC696_07850 [Bacillus wiedmannii]TKI89773.1 hypothetical protein FC699_25360 [Bacillus wiedmannii]
MSTLDKNRMEILKRNNRRKGLINELSNLVTISKESFMDAESNDLFCKELFSKLEKVSDKKIFGDSNYEQNITLSIELLKETVKNIDFPVNQGRLFFFTEYDLEAIKLNINEVFDNLENLSIESGFLNGNGDFVLVGDDLEFGLCVERTEYHYEFSMWGITTV